MTDRVRRVDALDRRVAQAWAGIKQGGVRFYYTTQNDLQLTTYTLFISGIFHRLFSNFSSWWVTETTDSEAMAERGTTVQRPQMQQENRSFRINEIVLQGPAAGDKLAPTNLCFTSFDSRLKML